MPFTPLASLTMPPTAEFVGRLLPSADPAMRCVLVLLACSLSLFATKVMAADVVTVEPSAVAADESGRIATLEEAYMQLRHEFDQLLRQNERRSLKPNEVEGDSERPTSSPQAIADADRTRSSNDQDASLATMDQLAPAEAPLDFSDQPPDIRTDEPMTSADVMKTDGIFDEGFTWETKDGEYSLTFHNEKARRRASAESPRATARRRCAQAMTSS